MSRQPNLFILGAPKCGTTSLVRWLDAHRDVYVPSVKEPHHYNIDEKQVYFPNRDDYLALFDGGESARYRVDASVWYLHSKVAVSRILGDCPDARFLVCLRNPVDMAFSLHSQYVHKSGREPLTSFEQAWSLSEKRLEGRAVSGLASDPRYLSYKYSCRIGSQSKRLLDQVRGKRIRFVVLDDLIRSPTRTLSSILEFLELPEEVPLGLPHENPAVIRRSPTLHRAVRYLARGTKRLGIGPVPKGVKELFYRINTVGKKPRMAPETRRMATEYFLDEIRLVWEVTGSWHYEWIECLQEDEAACRDRTEKTG